MKRIVFLSFVFSVLTINLMYAKKLTELPEVDRPFTILKKKDQLFVSDWTVKLHLYSMKDFSYVRQISKKGEGPGECRTAPKVTPSDLLTSYMGKKLQTLNIRGFLVICMAHCRHSTRL